MDARRMEHGHARANGVDLFYEVRGDGPPLLLIAGGLADAGQFTALAEALAARWRVITYDRRGNSRSSAPAEWSSTSVEEQADDAAALLETLGIAATSLYGHSIGAPIALDVAMRRPEIVETLVLHDPALMSVLADPAAVMAVVGPIVENGMRTGGPAAAADAFFRFAVGPAVAALEPATYERMTQNGDVLFRIEFAALSGWTPEAETLARSHVPVLILVGRDTPPFFAEAADWLSARLGVAVQQLPGGHGAPFDHPSQVAARVSELLARQPA
jgi:pimeloyl-ACP methyl ester carboxylesterase